ncbi:MAG: hypothetical protein ACHQVS_02730 [Candidatus Babeliales bacterium]
MNLKITLLLTTCMAISCAHVIAEEPSDDTTTEETTRRKKCLKARNLKICNNAFIGGTLTAGSFALSPAAAVGTVGVPGLGGDLAYGAVGNTGAQTVANGAALTFNLLTTVPGAGVLQTSSGITVESAGIYKVVALIAGEATGAGQTFVFQLQNDGVAIPNATIASNTSGSAGVLNVLGFGIISLPANSSLTLVNVSGSSVPLFASGSAANAVFTVERIA